MLSLSFSKLVSIPTETEWSQAYNAGNLFATLTLSKSDETDETQLGSIGKSVFSNLEAEFFTLEKKDLAGIKEAILKSLESVPREISADLICVFFKENILYIYLSGGGKILMRRDNKTGTLLEGNNDEKRLLTASGLLKNNDLIILQSLQFTKDITHETLSSALELELPNDIAEALSPSMHEKIDGGQAAIIINYKTPTEHSAIQNGDAYANPDHTQEKIDDLDDPTIDEAIHLDESQADYTEPDEIQSTDKINSDLPDVPIHHYTENPATNSSILSRFKRLSVPLLNTGKFSQLSHKRKLFLSIAVIIFLVLTTSIILAKQKQADSQTQALFESIYNPALKDYEDGKSIESINKTFARDEFISARSKLKEGEGKFKEGTTEDKKIKDLLSKINAELGTGDDIKKTEAKEIKPDSGSLLVSFKENKNALGITKDKDSIYALTTNAIVNLENDKKIITNEDDWSKAVSLSNYQGNFYILDQDNGILKYTAGSDGYGVSNYFKTKPANIKDAVSMSIDGSIWLLFKDGSIFQYTKGESDGFKAKGLVTPLKNATQIVTGVDTESVYILDNGNSRIVKLGKDGNFEEQYVADILKSASFFEVQESDDKILILSGDKFYEISL